MSTSNKRLLETDPLTGLMTWHSYDSQTDETIITYTSDAEKVIEENKVLQNDPEFSKVGIANDFWLYARIPVGVQLDWLINHGVDVTNKEHGARMSKLLNDPEYKYLKTTTKNHKFK